MSLLRDSHSRCACDCCLCLYI